jgi:hypothetical protein
VFAGKSHSSTDKSLDPLDCGRVPANTMNKAAAKHQLGSTTRARRALVKFNRIIAQWITLCRQMQRRRYPFERGCKKTNSLVDALDVRLISPV